MVYSSRNVASSSACLPGRASRIAIDRISCAIVLSPLSPESRIDFRISVSGRTGSAALPFPYPDALKSNQRSILELASPLGIPCYRRRKIEEAIDLQPRGRRPPAIFLLLFRGQVFLLEWSSSPDALSIRARFLCCLPRFHPQPLRRCCRQIQIRLQQLESAIL